MDDAKAHAAALETFIRLTESDREHHDMSTIDQGAVRAALARTAARKKPRGAIGSSRTAGHPRNRGQAHRPEVTGVYRSFERAQKIATPAVIATTTR